MALAHRGNLLIVECAFPDGYKSEGHLTPGEIGRIATQAQVQRVVLTHCYPLCDEFDIISPIKEKFKGEVIRAEDLMEINV